MATAMSTNNTISLPSIGQVGQGYREASETYEQKAEVKDGWSALRRVQAS